MNVSDYFNSSKISDITNDLQNYTFQHTLSEGIFGFGFSPFTNLMLGFFWTITFSVIGVAVYSWKGLYPTIGYFAAILLITAAIIPTNFFSMLGIFLALMITAVLYKVFFGKGHVFKKAGKEIQQEIQQQTKEYSKEFSRATRSAQNWWERR